MKVLLSLSSRKLRNGGINPKNYPYGKELIELLRKENITTIQTRVADDPILDADEVKSELTFKSLEKIIKECDTFISVDNFIQHYATYLGKKGIVIFSKSDPIIFGHSQNINILKSRNYLRPGQFGTWEEDQFIKEAFIEPDIIVSKLKKLFASSSNNFETN